MMLPTSSLRTRFIVTAILLIVTVLPAVIYTQKLVREESKKSTLRIAEHSAFQSLINSLEQSLQTTQSELYYYSLSLDEAEKSRVLQFLSEAEKEVNALSKHNIVNQSLLIGDTIESLVKSINELSVEAKNLLEILAKVETRFPAAPILLDKLQPTGTEFKAAIELALIEGDELINEAQQINIIGKLRDLRFAWAQQVSAVRVYVANRSGIFGHPTKGMAENAISRELYAERVEELLESLRIYDDVGLLGTQQSIALKQMINAVDKYEQDFSEAATIYTSDNWRADVPFFNNKIRPAFNGVWNMVYQLQTGLEGLSEDDVKKHIQISNDLSKMIWIFVAFVVFALLVGYLVLEYVIRRPIIEVTKALEAEAEGTSYVPVMPPYITKETGVLALAYHEMREQVRSRQTRLQAILDNAGEGIITVDADGFIETFNTAAQLLFGFTAKEAIGKQSRNVIRLTDSRVHGDFFEFCQSPFSKNQINEIVVTARHRDGAEFPMSINVSDLWVEGRQLYIAIVQDINERVALMDNLRTMAEHDSLTGLYNRDYFMTELDRVVENIKRGVRNDFALLYVDLDNFKFVNDTLGHMAGDQLLVEVTKMFTRRNRKSDLLARIGGDEFAILIYGAKREQVVIAAESHRKLLAEYVFKYNGKIVNIGCSIGATLFGQEALIKEDLLAQADIACHIAKRSGRNRVHVYESEDNRSVTAMSEDMGWATLIKNAINTDDFTIMCQPIAETQTNHIERYEVLLRMNGANGEVLLPAGFLPAAERFGLIHSIDQWVVRRAISMLSKKLKLNSKTHFCINLSAKSLDDSGMFQLISTVLDQHHVPPSAITFEITENIAIANMNAAVEFLNQLRVLGCRTALDDFGVGYSSFAYLKDLPVDYVKIDGSFVRNISNDNLQCTMVRSMNDVAHAMGKKTVAEYVDSFECLETIKSIGIDYVQGYYIGKPAELDLTPKKASAEVIKLVTA